MKMKKRKFLNVAFLQDRWKGKKHETERKNEERREKETEETEKKERNGIKEIKKRNRWMIGSKSHIIHPFLSFVSLPFHKVELHPHWLSHPGKLLCRFDVLL